MNRALRMFVALTAFLGATAAPRRGALASEPPVGGGAPRGSAAEQESGPLAFVYTAVPVSFGVVRFLEVDSLNDSLRGAGLGELDRIMPSLSLALTAAYRGGLVLEPMYRFVIADTEETTLTCHQLVLGAGWLIYGRGDTVVYPVVGFGYGNSTLHIVSTEVAEERFADAIVAPTGETSMSSSSFLLHAGVAATLWGSGHGDFIGLRTGLTWAPVSSGWKRRGVIVDGGPSPPMTGGYLALALGFHSPRWR